MRSIRVAWKSSYHFSPQSCKIRWMTSTRAAYGMDCYVQVFLWLGQAWVQEVHPPAFDHPVTRWRARSQTGLYYFYPRLG